MCTRVTYRYTCTRGRGHAQRITSLMKGGDLCNYSWSHGQMYSRFRQIHFIYTPVVCPYVHYAHTVQCTVYMLTCFTPYRVYPVYTLYHLYTGYTYHITYTYHTLCIVRIVTVIPNMCLVICFVNVVYYNT